MNDFITGIEDNLFQIDEMNTGIKLKVDKVPVFTHENSYNVHISLFHAFYFMLAYSIVLPTNIILVGALGYDYTLTGLAMAFTPFGGIFSIYLCNRLLVRTYKQPMIYGVICVVISSMLYILSAPVDHVALLFTSRFILGLGSAQLINKNYIIHFIPRKKIPTYQLYLTIATLCGLSFGPLLNTLIFLITQSVLERSTPWNNVMINPQWVILIIGLIFIPIILKFYTEPIQANFTMVLEKKQEIAPAMLNKESISREERVMIDKLDEILKQINEKNKFSDTNLVTRNIEQIAWKENKTSSYIYKCFIVFISILIIVRVSSYIYI
jgi:hypothetical protein